MRGKSLGLCLLAILLFLFCSACAVSNRDTESVPREIAAVRELASQIRGETGITVHTDPTEELGFTSTSFSFARDYTEDGLSAVLSETAAIFERFPAELWNEIEVRTGKPVHLCFVTEIRSFDAESTEGQAMLYESDCFYLIIPATTAFHLTHELMHLMERALSCDSAFYTEQNERFCALNPDDFSYGSTGDNAYTLFNASDDEVYFLNLYSKTDAVEDRAELFKELMDYDAELIFQPFELCPGLRAKAELLCAMLRGGFTCLKDAEHLPWEEALQ